MGIPILVRQHLYIETVPRIPGIFWLMQLCRNGGLNKNVLYLCFADNSMKLFNQYVHTEWTFISLKTKTILDAYFPIYRIVRCLLLLCHAIVKVSVITGHPIYIYIYNWFNSLWPGDAIWRHRTQSSLVKVMAYSLNAQKSNQYVVYMKLHNTVTFLGGRWLDKWWLVIIIRPRDVSTAIGFKLEWIHFYQEYAYQMSFLSTDHDSVASISYCP